MFQAHLFSEKRLERHLYRIIYNETDSNTSLSVGRISRSLRTNCQIYRVDKEGSFFLGVLTQRNLSAICFDFAEHSFEKHVPEDWRDISLCEIISDVKKAIHGDVRPRLEDFKWPELHYRQPHLNQNGYVVKILRESIRIAAGYENRNSLRCGVSFGLASVAAAEAAESLYDPEEGRKKSLEELERQGYFIVDYLKSKSLFQPSGWGGSFEVKIP